MGRAASWTAGLLATILVAGGCDLADPLLIGSETEEIFYVQKPEISSDGKTGLFAFNQVFQRQRLTWPEHTKYWVWTRGIGTYDLESGRIKVVHRSKGSIGSGSSRTAKGGYGILGVCWDKVLVGRDGDKSYYWLDVTTGTLTRLPLSDEWAARGLDVRHFFVLDRRGTIAMWANPSKRLPMDRSRGMGALWLRRPSGEYEDVGLFLYVYPTGDRRILFTSPLVDKYGAAPGHYVLYDVETGTRSHLSLQDGTNMESKPSLRNVDLHMASSWCAGAKRDIQFGVPRSGEALKIPEDKLEILRLGRGGWEPEHIALKVEDLRNALRH
jgi:hypothetical protein